MKNYKLEHGFTLLELLASIVILVIVITSLFSFFTQSAKFSKKNEDHLVAMNLAREVLEAVNSYPYNEDELGIETCYEDRGKDDLYPCVIYSSEILSDSEDTINLLLVKINIYKKAQEVGGNDQLLANAYGYVRE